MLLPFFSETERHSAELELAEKRTDLMEKIKAYNRRFSGSCLFYLSLKQSDFD
jgi:hypothetical protein